MKEIKLELNKTQALKNQYEYIVKIGRNQKGYFIITGEGANHKLIGPFEKIMLERSQKDCNDIFIFGYKYLGNEIYRVGINGLELTDKIDNSDCLADYLDKNYDVTVEEQFKDCQLMGKVKGYSILKDKNGQFFAVNNSVAPQPIENYKKFDSYTELYHTAYLNGINMYNEDIIRLADTLELRKFLNSIRLRGPVPSFSTKDTKARAVYELTKIKFLKDIVGVENFKNGTFSARRCGGGKFLNVEETKNCINERKEIANDDRGFVGTIINGFRWDNFEFEKTKNFKFKSISDFGRYIKYFSTTTKFDYPVLEIIYDDQRRLFKILENDDLIELGHSMPIAINRQVIEVSLEANYPELYNELCQLLVKRFEYYRKIILEELEKQAHEEFLNRLNALKDFIIVERDGVTSFELVYKNRRKIFRLIDGKITQDADCGLELSTGNWSYRDKLEENNNDNRIILQLLSYKLDNYKQMIENELGKSETEQIAKENSTDAKNITTNNNEGVTQ